MSRRPSPSSWVSPRAARYPHRRRRVVWFRQGQRGRRACPGEGGRIPGPQPSRKNRLMNRSGPAAHRWPAFNYISEVLAMSFPLDAIGRDHLASALFFSLCDFEDDFELNRHPQRKTRDADDQPNCCLLAAKNVEEHVRHSVRNPGLVEEIPGGSHEYAEPHNPSDSIK